MTNFNFAYKFKDKNIYKMFPFKVMKDKPIANVIKIYLHKFLILIP